MRRNLILVLALITYLAGTFSAAEDDDRGGSKRRHDGPPQIAIEACAAAVEGDSCSFSGRRGDTVRGTCTTMRDTLVCFPEGGPPRRTGTDEPDA